jgi:predicted dehydrogenase
MNELEYYDGRGDDAEAEGFRRILVTDPGHPYADYWWPTGHGLGYEHLFTHQVIDMLSAIGTGQPPAPSFAEALDVQRVLAAVEASAADQSRATAVSREQA